MGTSLLGPFLFTPRLQPGVRDAANKNQKPLKRFLIPSYLESAGVKHGRDGEAFQTEAVSRGDKLYHRRGAFDKLSALMSNASQNNSGALVDFRSVSYAINGTRKIIDDLSLTVLSGETVVLLGESGCGKTTTLRLVNRLLTPTSGRVLVQGKATTQWDAIQLRRRTGYVIQEAGLFPHFTVAENVALVPSLERWDRDRIAHRTNELLELVGLDSGRFAGRYPRELSGGQRQRVGVARALAADPPLLLMDEPFGALDPLTRASLQKEFAELKGRLGKTVIFVTHDVREALLLGTRIALMDAGRIVLLESPAAFVKSENQLARAYLETLERSS
jgi:osmoprotectant transport system ATP-binding protein